MCVFYTIFAPELINVIKITIMTKIITVFMVLAISLGSCFQRNNNTQYEGKYRGEFTMDGTQIATGDLEYFSNPLDEDGIMLYVLPMSKTSTGHFETTCEDFDLVASILLDRFTPNPYVTDGMMQVKSVDVTSEFTNTTVNTTFYFHIDTAVVDTVPDWQIEFVGAKVVSADTTNAKRMISYR